MAQQSSAQQNQKNAIVVDSSASGVKCDGGNEALGHPQVYYSFDGKSEVTCHYCGQVFVRGAKAAAH